MRIELKRLEATWLEATWLEDDKQVHCESFSGHPEHITMLRARALEFGTELDEALIKECIANFKMPTDAELKVELIKQKLAEYKAYLSSTDFKMTVDYYATLSKEIQDELILKRNEAREFIRANS